MLLRHFQLVPLLPRTRKDILATFKRAKAQISGGPGRSNYNDADFETLSSSTSNCCGGGVRDFRDISYDCRSSSKHSCGPQYQIPLSNL